MGRSWSNTKVNPIVAISIIAFAIALVISFGIYIYGMPSAVPNTTESVQKGGITLNQPTPPTAVEASCSGIMKN